MTDANERPYAAESSGKPQRRFNILELVIGGVIGAALLAIAIPAFKTYRLRLKLSERTPALAAIREAEFAFMQKWGVFAKIPIAPRTDDRLDGRRAAWPTGDGAAASGFRLIGYEPTGDTFFGYCVIENDARPTSPQPAPLEASSPALTCPESGTRAEHAGGRTTLTGTVTSSIGIADIAIHARGDIDDDGRVAGWFLTDEQGGDEVPDPLSSGDTLY